MNAPTLVVSWWGQENKPGTSDTQGVSTDSVIPVVFSVAESTGTKIAFHLEPYPGRTAASVKQDVTYLLQKYGSSNAMKRIKGLPVMYVYDSYHISAQDWARVLSPGGESSIRGTEFDCFFIGLWLNAGDGASIVEGSFDAAYTYFASEGFSYGSRTRNWASMSAAMKKAGKLFIASVGPGYVDEKIRPWNTHNTKDREAGKYYDRMWQAAVDADADLVSVTSYNEWGEGTQIESASNVEGYLTYGPGDKNDHIYINATARWASLLQAGEQGAGREL